MAESSCKILDPRIRRTRQLLRQALASLLEKREFEELTVQEIAEAATVNRATFYDHYADKFALLECMVAARFHELLAERGVKFDGTCLFALKAITLGVCDFLAGTIGIPCERQRRIEPHLELAVISVVRGMILGGLQQHPAAGAASPEIIATTVSWAIYGGAKEWVQTPGRRDSEAAADTVARLVYRVLSPLPRDFPETAEADMVETAPVG